MRTWGYFAQALEIMMVSIQAHAELVLKRYDKAVKLARQASAIQVTTFRFCIRIHSAGRLLFRSDRKESRVLDIQTQQIV